jgi:hypothetical protein
MPDEASDPIDERNKLLGELTEAFNRLEWHLHWLAWTGIRGVTDEREESAESFAGGGAVGAAVTGYMSIDPLTKLVRRLLKVGQYGPRSDVIKSAMDKISSMKVITRRNQYVHRHWDFDSVDEDYPSGRGAPLRQWIQDLVEKGGAAYDESLVPHDDGHLRQLINDIEECIEFLLDSMGVPALDDDSEHSVADEALPVPSGGSPRSV